MTTPKHVAIIGAGMGGLSFAIKLKQQLDSSCDFIFTIFEKASEVGGTWRDNIYPGAASDVDTHFYSLSTDLNPDWSHTHSLQEEIQRYWLRLSKKYDLYPNIVFNTRITAARWDAAAQNYRIEGENILTGETTSQTAEILISATGVLEQPNYPNIPGISTFRGGLFHSARWQRDIPLKGRRVGVIGSGASATQFVPIISQDPSVKVTQFLRTPNWFFPPVRTPFSSTWKWAFSHVPLFMRFYRLLQFLKAEGLYMIFSRKYVRMVAQEFSRRYILWTAPADYQNALIPNFPMGCKRILFDTQYLGSLHRPNVRLSFDGISQIVGDGIITNKDEEVPLDVIILATGFNTDDYPICIRGRHGQTVQDYYDACGAPTAYLGTTLPGFPNFYMLSGPNTATGHTSVLYSEELQINYCMTLISPVLRGEVASFEVTSEATDTFNTWLQGRLARSVFTGCHSWYRKGYDGIISSIFPGSQFTHWWLLRSPTWSHYKVVKGDAWIQARRGKPVSTAICTFSLMIIFAGIYATGGIGNSW